MFGPKCGYEYREGFSVCSDCNVGLVDRLEEEKRAEVSKPPLDVYKSSRKKIRMALVMAAII